MWGWQFHFTILSRRERKNVLLQFVPFSNNLFIVPIDIIMITGNVIILTIQPPSSGPSTSWQPCCSFSSSHNTWCPSGRQELASSPPYKVARIISGFMVALDISDLKVGWAMSNYKVAMVLFDFDIVSVISGKRLQWLYLTTSCKG